MSEAVVHDLPGRDEALGSRVPVRARVLLVDDDERNLLALSEVLSPVAEVVTASSGRLALRELLKDEFATILLDVFMPEMDGYETAALIRQRPQAARTPIIFLSAVNKETEHLMRGYAMGAVDYVFKPVDPVVLKSKVAVFVDLFEARQQIAEQAAAEQALRESTLRAEAEGLAYQRELQQAQLRQAAILEALPLAMYEATVGDDGRLIRRFVGGDIARFAGDDAAALLSGTLHWDERILDDDASGLQDLVTGDPGSVRSMQYRWRRSGGALIHVVDQCVRPDPEGAWIGTLIDVSAQRELEQQLVQSRKTEALGQLTGGVAHDFNNLLAAVLGGLNLLERKLAIGEREKLIVEQMRHAAESGVTLVKRLMSFARKQELAPSSVDPMVLRDSVTGLVEHALGEDVVLSWHVAEKDARLHADAAQLELALVNLVVNARDAMPGGGEVAVSIQPAPGPEGTAPGNPDYVRVRVRDSGAGIAPELIERVVEPFFTTKAAGKGTGLGLSMVAGFVQQSGGSFHISSEVGRGTQIDMFFPSAADTADSPGPRAGEGAPDNLVASVLVVDDDDSVRLVVAEQLRDMGLEVVEAEDAERALELLEGGARIELVLTDFAMPGRDGLELILAIGERWPGQRCAIMTGNPDARLQNGASGVDILRKPIDCADLTRALRAH